MAYAGLHKQVVSVLTVESRKVQVRVGLGARTSRGEKTRERGGSKEKEGQAKHQKSTVYCHIDYYVV